MDMTRWRTDFARQDRNGPRATRSRSASCAFTRLETSSAGNHAFAQNRARELKADPLTASETRLSELLVQYTEFNPEVALVRKQIELLKAERASAANTPANQPPPVAKSDSDAGHPKSSGPGGKGAPARRLPHPPFGTYPRGTSLTQFRWRWPRFQPPGARRPLCLPCQAEYRRRSGLEFICDIQSGEASERRKERRSNVLTAPAGPGARRRSTEE